MRFPRFVERLVLGLKVESHDAEAGPFEVKVEVLVVLEVIARAFLSAS